MTLLIIANKNFVRFPNKTTRPKTVRRKSHENLTQKRIHWTNKISYFKPVLFTFCHILTPEIQSVRFGGGSLGLPFPKSRFILKTWKNKQTASTAFLQELSSRLNQLQIDVTSGGQIVIWTKLGQWFFFK